MKLQLKAKPKLATLREKKQLTQEQLAEILTTLLNENVTPGRYQQYELGNRYTPLEIALVIAKVLGCKLNVAFEGSDKTVYFANQNAVHRSRS